jgi:hypothetical protein
MTDVMREIYGGKRCRSDGDEEGRDRKGGGRRRRRWNVEGVMINEMKR